MLKDERCVFVSGSSVETPLLLRAHVDCHAWRVTAVSRLALCAPQLPLLDHADGPARGGVPVRAAAVDVRHRLLPRPARRQLRHDTFLPQATPHIRVRGAFLYLRLSAIERRSND